MDRPRHLERHFAQRIGWLRAAVLGANDGIVSTASLVVGVAAANTGRSGVLVAGVAGLVAGAMSMTRATCLRRLAVGHRESRSGPRAEGTRAEPGMGTAGAPADL
jgi:hypothetical protein